MHTRFSEREQIEQFEAGLAWRGNIVGVRHDGYVRILRVLFDELAQDPVDVFQLLQLQFEARLDDAVLPRHAVLTRTQDEIKVVAPNKIVSATREQHVVERVVRQAFDERELLLA